MAKRRICFGTVKGFVTMSVALNVMGHGCIMGFPAILIPSLREPESHIHPTVAQESWIASVVGFALIAGNLIIVAILDQIGRKKTHLLTIPPVLSGWFLLIIANSIAGLIVARFLQGISMGMLGPACSIIIGEVADPKYRGMFLTTISLSLTSGVLFCHALGTYFIWQTCAMICSLTAIASLVLIVFTPESPSWLISKGRYEKAREVFLWLRGHSEEQKKELEEMITAHALRTKSSVEDSKRIPFKQRIKNSYQYFIHPWHLPEFYKPIIVMVFLYTMFQFAGINVISSYAIDIIEGVVGLESNSSFLMVMFDFERLLCNILAVFLMKTLKRRTLLFSTGSMCILSYLAKATYVYLKQKNQVPDGQWIPIMLLTLYMFSLTVGITCLPFALSGELFPAQYRGLGGGLSILALSMNFFIAVKCFPVLRDAIGLAFTYVIYASVVTVCLISLWFMLPETKDRTLQDIENAFKGQSVVTSIPVPQIQLDPAVEQANDVNEAKA